MGLFFTQYDTRPQLERIADATRQTAKSISDVSRSIDRQSISIESLGPRETVRYEETLWFDSHGEQVKSADGLARVLRDAVQNEPWRYEHLQVLQHMHCGFSCDFDLEAAMIKAGLLFSYQVHHFWNVVVGLESHRHSYRCLPDGMAREIYSNPNDWR